MENKDLNQLQKEYSKMKFITGFFAGILTVLFIATIYSSISQKTFDPLLGVALALAVILLANVRKEFTLKKEFEARQV